MDARYDCLHFAGASILKRPYTGPTSSRFDIASLIVLYATFSLGLLLDGFKNSDVAILIIIIVINIGFALGALFLICRQVGALVKRHQSKLSGVELEQCFITLSAPLGIVSFSQLMY